MAKHPNVFTIPAGAPFLDTLAAAVLDGRLIAGFSADDPFALADVTLYLPTRRAARALRESFLTRFGRPLLLPRIHTLGDIDEDELVPDADDPHLPPAASATDRQLVLTRLVLSWSGALVRAAADLPNEELVVPASPADAARLAAALGRLIDQVGTEPEAWAGLFSGIPADLARYWEITLTFLEIATDVWPAWLAGRGLLDPGARRDLLIRGESERLMRHGSPAPVIAAGSTGSVPATAALLTAIAQLPNGAVVLPGLDLALDDESWAEIGPGERAPVGASHPQYGLKKLLEALGAGRKEVQPIGDASITQQLRGRFVSESMRPAGTTERWSGQPALSDSEKAQALEAIGMIEAGSEREEALAVATILRGAIETPGHVAALVTPDRALARRVAVELRRWDITVDDSAGRPLMKSPAGVLARLVAETALGGARADTLLALAKHPLAAFGLRRADARRAARALERAILRGPRLRPGLGPLRHAVAQTKARLGQAQAEGEPRENRTNASRRLSAEKWTDAENLAERIHDALRLLEALAERGGAVPLSEIVVAHLAAIDAVTRSEGRSASAAAGEDAETLAQAFEELQASAEVGPAIEPQDYPELFAALIERAVVRRRGGLDSRIYIWGALEARLQSVDVIVLGGLNEGTWPTQTRLDPMLSRPMRAALALEPPERRIGLAAHDFSQALGHPVIWLTRAARQDNDPKVASRWLQRLTAYAGKELAAAMRDRGNAMLALSRRLDVPLAIDKPQRPQPSPPLERRPPRLSVTRIETLIRDPYAIYAQYVLDLQPFEALGKLPDAADRGSLVHDILEKFIAERPRGPFDRDAEARLLAIGREAFGKHSDFPEVIALWWPRFEKIARWFIRIEAQRTDVLERHVEANGRWEVTPDFTLSVRADRIDRLADGGLAIIDYKTGTPPAIDEVLALAPQLPLEGLMARRGGFDGIDPGEPSKLIYYRLSGRNDGGEYHDRSERQAKGKKTGVTLPQALASAERKLIDLVSHFADPSAKYQSRKIPKRGRVFVGDYDHLARVAEWTTTEEEIDDPGPVQP
jgi:ATP-dependent helicase/nuclease subunit B